MNKKYYNLGLDYPTTDVIDRLYDAAKWCYVNNFKPLPIEISEHVFKKLYWHPQLIGRLGIDKMFPPSIEILGFCFKVNFSLPEQEEYDVPLLVEDMIIKDALVFNFGK